MLWLCVYTTNEFIDTSLHCSRNDPLVYVIRNNFLEIELTYASLSSNFPLPQKGMDMDCAMRIINGEVVFNSLANYVDKTCDCELATDASGNDLPYFSLNN